MGITNDITQHKRRAHRQDVLWEIFQKRPGDTVQRFVLAQRFVLEGTIVLILGSKLRKVVQR
jgi:hypothetical protein